jgi:hypothetical protein
MRDFQLKRFVLALIAALSWADENPQYQVNYWTAINNRFCSGNG